MNRLINDPLLEPAEKAEYLSLHGRILLQIGDVHGAEKKFLAARKFKTASAERELIDRGLMAVAQNDFQEAYKFFQNAHLKDPNSVIVQNNICVCLLYTGRLKEAIKMYETAIEKNITGAMNSEFLINLATLYELETTDSNTKKLDLLKKISQNVVDCNVNLMNCLKLQNIGVPC
jgi:trafficking protein particle complex subunit 12